jgi:hypothetical protein
MTAAGSPISASMLKDIERGAPVEADHVIGDLLRRAPAASRLRTTVAAAHRPRHLKAYEARRAAATALKLISTDRPTVGLAVEDGLDVVAVGIDDEGAVVARVVLGADARLAVVLAAGGERGGVEAVDGGAVGGLEARCTCVAPVVAIASPLTNSSSDQK